MLVEANIDTVSGRRPHPEAWRQITALDPERVIAEAADTLETVGKRIS